MLEYALISATVVVAFAIAAQMGYNNAWNDRLQQPVNTYYVRFPDECLEKPIIKSCATYLNNLNTQVQIY